MDRTFQLIESASDPACAIDHDHTLTFWNSRASKLLGFAADEVLGQPCYRVFGGTDDAGCAICRRDCKTLLAAISGRPVGTRRMATRCSDGRVAWLNFHALVVPSCWHDRSVLVYIMSDITRRVAIEHELRHHNMPVIRSDEGGSSEPDESMLLTAREMEVLRLLASGMSTASLAAKLFISETTVRNHVQHILRKLGVHTRLEAVALALRDGLIGIESSHL